MKMIHGERLHAAAHRPNGLDPMLEAKQTSTDTVNIDPIEESLKLSSPAWPLQNIVAVNPFWFQREKDFCDVFFALESVFHSSLFMPTAYYREKYQTGEISDQSLQDALDHGRRRWSFLPESSTAWLEASNQSEQAIRNFKSFAEVIEPRYNFHQIIIDDISKYCAGYFDCHQANIRYPWQSGSFWTGWFEAQHYDKAMQHCGLNHFRQVILSFSGHTSAEVIKIVLGELGLFNKQGQLAYLQRLLATSIGWASQFKYLEWQKSLGYTGFQQAQLVDFLAIRLLYDYAVYREFQEERPELTHQWLCSFNELVAPQQRSRLGQTASYVWQLALELSYQRRISEQIKHHFSKVKEASKPYKMAFCIDVRSEILRRRIEQVSSEIQTMGFAGFFGAPIDFHRSDEHAAGHRLPALLHPAYQVHEKPKQSKAAVGPHERFQILHIFSYFKNFRKASLASFLYVELFGILAIGNLGLRTWKTLVARITGHRTPLVFSSDHSEPCMESATCGDGTPLTLAEKVKRCASVLKSLGLKDDFGKLVILCGHGAVTNNNALASALDCGACGGHAGDINARFMTNLLNSPEVRQGLSEKGIRIPQETWFQAAIHETVTDKVYFLDEEEIPTELLGPLTQIKQDLNRASELASHERNTARSDVLDSHPDRRSHNWSEVRPEWGLAGNASFVIAPRQRTKSIKLASRTFLHDYNWQQDEGFQVLEGIMTAPMIVTNWINMQYYASVTLPDHFGAGRKILHNITGETGVIEGNGGDLRIGLAHESIHDGKSYIHEPLRLAVYIEAPRKALEDIIAKHQVVRELIDNEWIFLLQIDPESGMVSRRVSWQDYQPISN